MKQVGNVNNPQEKAETSEQNPWLVKEDELLLSIVSF